MHSFAKKSTFLILASYSITPVLAADTTTELSTLVVTSQQTPYIQLSETATKTNQDLLDTPLTVNTINKAFIDDLQAETLADVYPYIVGLNQSGNNANSVTLRGLSSNLQNIQIDGLPGLASRFGSPSTANIERVEVLKGPASVLYGQMQPGGLINIVTKKPEEEAKNSISFSGRSYASPESGLGSDLGSTITYDTTGPLNDDKTLLYRFIGSVENIDSFRDGVNANNLYLYPSLSYQIDPDTKATVGMEYIRERRDADDGLVAVNNDIHQIADAETRYQEDGDYDNDEGLVLFGRLENQLNNSTLLRVNMRSVYHEDDRKLYENNRVNDASNIDDATLRRRDRHQFNKRQYHFFDANIMHSFETAGLFHQAIVGINGGFERSDYERIRFGSNITPPISVINPVTGGSPATIKSGNHRVTDYYNAGLYAQDTIDLNDYFSVMLGGRFDTQRTRYNEKVTNDFEKANTHKFLPQAGIVYRATDNISLYASHTESFNPNTIEKRSASGDSFAPELGTQNEYGIKASLFDDKLNITAAHFKIIKDNIIETNNNDEYELLGQLESKGMEFELQALPIENWQIRLGYAYTDSILSKSPTANLVGQQNAFAPTHNAFIWTRYNMPKPVWGGRLGSAVGVNYQSSQFTNADPDKQVELPSYVRFDLGFYYDIQSYQVALNIENLFDKTYYTGGKTNINIYQGDPRLITLSLKKSF
ncbi:hypothetical protein LCGC14_0797210 [marine sediment metagenome]|uniref:TonB-dependent siderophore receptor n=1 Tax=marine sediment metagenome TaxID=412755 RepID=A0A0F9PV60_9ZZZZ